MSRARSAVALGVLAVVAVASIALALEIGAARGSIVTALRDPNSLDRAVLVARAARVVLGALAGGALAVVGAAFQALLRNPLGDPYALGVSGGAALAATVAVIAGAGALVVPLAAFAGAVASMMFVLAAARVLGQGGAAALLIAGLVFNACANAGLAFLRSIVSATKAQETLSLLLGFVAEERWSTVSVVGVLVGIGAMVLFVLSKPMNLLTLGEESAASLGIDVRRAELVIFVAASMMVGGVVSVCGLIPFVGLVVPHYVRAMTGPDHRVLLPACFLGGASLLVLADALTRWLFLRLGSEPPVGAITALLGGPVFFVVLRRMRSSGAVQ